MQSQFLDRPSTEAEKENEFEIEEFSMTEDERQKRKTKLNTLYPAGSLAYNPILFEEKTERHLKLKNMVLNDDEDLNQRASDFNCAIC
jgi:hypothetical protein